ncbi:hypothetical protein SAMN02745673_01412 [Marinactinospora thermotolerans DSM 45154]|uniref:Uncharacterized protein n=1 Tax=Marinactinospora thermotolerans DSM 45154 TaxID=1122192 RepID=A0A1T4NFE0_9ACTN|nr:hypothetical protein SAMN02745673_01412 [Marinactinospora thermotolerans DSM 45154]
MAATPPRATPRPPRPDGQARHEHPAGSPPPVPGHGAAVCRDRARCPSPPRLEPGGGTAAGGGRGSGTARRTCPVRTPDVLPRTGGGDHQRPSRCKTAGCLPTRGRRMSARPVRNPPSARRSADGRAPPPMSAGPHAGASGGPRRRPGPSPPPPDRLRTHSQPRPLERRWRFGELASGRGRRATIAPSVNDPDTPDHDVERADTPAGARTGPHWCGRGGAPGRAGSSGARCPRRRSSGMGKADRADDGRCPVPETGTPAPCRRVRTARTSRSGRPVRAGGACPRLATARPGVSSAGADPRPDRRTHQTSRSYRSETNQPVRKPPFQP